MTGPYRDLPARSALSCCEVCGGNSDEERCLTCAAARLTLEELLPTLEVPIVLIEINWTLREPAGAGLVLVDRWRTIALCASRLPALASARAVEGVARARARLWAPGVYTAIGWEEMERALAEVLVRTPARMDKAICAGFRHAWRQAQRIAERARSRHGIRGSEVLDLAAEPFEEPT